MRVFPPGRLRRACLNCARLFGFAATNLASISRTISAASGRRTGFSMRLILHPPRRSQPQHLSLCKRGDSAQMADVVAFAFKTRSLAAGLLNDALDHLFGIDVNATLGAVEEFDLPIVLPISISIDDLLAPIGGNGSHIERGQLGLEAHSRGYALINRRPGAATRGDVDDGIGRAPDLADELAINLRVKGGPARTRVA